MISYKKYEDHDEWLDLRRNSIGGSDAGTIMCVNEYASPYSLWREKTGRSEGFAGNLITRVGSYLEEFVAQLFVEETGKKVRRNNRVIYNDAYPFAHANVDREVVGENAIVEIKTTNDYKKIADVEADECPAPWLCQVQHYMAVGGYSKAYVAVLMNNRKFRVLEIDRDYSEISTLMTKEAEFWMFVQMDKAPPVSGLDCDKNIITEQYPLGGLGPAALEGYAQLARRYYELGKNIKEMEKERNLYRNEIAKAMGNHTWGDAGRYRVKWGDPDEKGTRRFEVRERKKK